MNVICCIICLIYAVNPYQAITAAFTADIECVTLEGPNSKGTDDSQSIVGCDDDYTLISCGFKSGPISVATTKPITMPDGSKISNNKCVAQNGQNIAESWVKAVANCCKINEKTFMIPPNTIFKAEFECNQYMSGQSDTDIDSIITSQCQLNDEYLFGCAAYTHWRNIRGFCPGDEHCDEIREGDVDYRRWQQHPTNRLIGYTVYDTKGTHGKCTTVKGTVTPLYGVQSQANCCRIIVNDARFSLKNIECHKAFLSEQIDPQPKSFWTYQLIPCLNDDYTMVSCHQNKDEYGEPPYGNYVENGKVCWIDNGHIGRVVNGNGLCCKATFTYTI